MPKKTKEAAPAPPGLEGAVGSAPVAYRPKEADTIHAVQWTGTTQSAQDILTFVRDLNGYRRLVVFRPVNGIEMALHLWSDKANTYGLVPVGHHICKVDGKGPYFVMSDAVLKDKYLVV